ncbi:MAG TPA: DUF5700 domain-containing putative Zn-dependent protease [Bryobacteraceae bacterium]|nr:DUF5700 domain-containing putative Zn-dependent protease [Bryobacteraceae bacterium]
MMRFALFLELALLHCGVVYAQTVRLTLDTSEADAGLAILALEAAHRTPAASDWGALFSAEPYRRLKAREASVNNAFTDDAFKAFLASEGMIARTRALQTTLQIWEQADLTALGERVLDYLPQGAQITAKVYLEIKPVANSFVWGSGSARAIFLYLNPALSRSQFENKVAHEAHHIGLESLNEKQESLLSGLSESQQRAVRWLGGFGEGEAMLGAAGSPEVHPHAADDEHTRARWDARMARFNDDLAAVQQFLLDILDGRIQGRDELARRAEPFYGEQGAFYTVGYKMASMVEMRFGRAALRDAMTDPRNLLILYNQAAAGQNGLRRWSPELLAGFGLR